MGQEGSLVSTDGASVEVPVEDPRSGKGPHGDVNLLPLEDRGAGRLASRVADV